MDKKVGKPAALLFDTNLANFYYYICLTAFLKDNLGKPAPER